MIIKHLLIYYKNIFFDSKINKKYLIIFLFILVSMFRFSFNIF
jgi:hypothetical protein